MGIAIVIAVAVAAVIYQSRPMGSPGFGAAGPEDLPGPEPPSNGTAASSILPKRPKVRCFTSKPIGQSFTEDQQITNVQAVDFDQDGLLDVVVCDALAHRVSWIRQYPRGVFEEFVCAPDAAPIKAPAHVEAFDFDRDGDLDLLVAALGQLAPSWRRIGSVVILENDGSMQFEMQVIRQDMIRVSDVRGGDLDGDGDNDLAVAMFGAYEGGTLWLENLGDGTFREHTLQTLSGPINCPLVDIDDDGDLDMALLVSQEWEEIYFFLNDGKGRFTAKLVWGAANEDFGSAALRLVDLDQDGDTDMLYCNGDAWDYPVPGKRPWHGVHWLENKGDLRFLIRRIVTFGGPYTAVPIDVDQDNNLDVVVTSMFNEWDDSDAQSVIWLENDGRMRFVRRDVTNTPTNIQTAAEGDFNGDGKIDFVTGGMYTDPPHDRWSRVLLWLNQWPS